MASQEFPTEFYVGALVRFLDTIQYNDTNFTHQERVRCLHYAYSKTAAHFAQPFQQQHIKAHPKKLQASLQTIVAMVVYAWAKASPEVMADLSIHYTYMLVLDDSTDDPASTMESFYQNLLAGKPQEHPWWRMVNGQFPDVLKHYGPFCALNMVRSTTDFFQGCWIEQYNFQGYPGSYDFPNFLRRMNGLGHCVGGSIFPKDQFDEQKLFLEITSVVAQMENWMVFVNDLMSFYKEFDEPRDQTSLVNNYARCDGISLEQALEKLTRDTIVDSQQIIAVFKDKDPVLFQTLVAFCQGYVTWHLCDPRYRLPELFDRLGESEDGRKMRAYLEAGCKVGAVDPSEWAYPTVAELAEAHRGSSSSSSSTQQAQEVELRTSVNYSRLGSRFFSLIGGGKMADLVRQLIWV